MVLSWLTWSTNSTIWSSVVSEVMNSSRSVTRSTQISQVNWFPGRITLLTRNLLISFDLFQVRPILGFVKKNILEFVLLGFVVLTAKLYMYRVTHKKFMIESAAYIKIKSSIENLLYYFFYAYKLAWFVLRKLLFRKIMKKVSIMFKWNIKIISRFLRLLRYV